MEWLIKEWSTHDKSWNWSHLCKAVQFSGSRLVWSDCCGLATEGIYIWYLLEQHPVDGKYSRQKRQTSTTTCHRLKQVKQNSTNNLTQSSSPDFTALSGGVHCFAFCVANKNRLFERSWLDVENFQPISRRGLKRQHRQQNGAHHLKEH